MASFAIPSFEDTVSTVERWAQAKATDNEIVEFLERLIKALGDPASGEFFKTSFGVLADRVMQTDETFSRLKIVIDKFVEEHGKEYPGLIPFQMEWHTYTVTWKEYISVSRGLAMKNAAEYSNYEMYLQMIPETKTKEELHQLARDLEEFAKNKSIGIPIDFEKLLELSRKVQEFQKRLSDYLDEIKVGLPSEVESLLRSMDALVVEITTLNKQMKDATLALGIAPWWAFVGGIVEDTVLAVLARKRTDKQHEFTSILVQLKEITMGLPALQLIRVQLAILVTFKLVVEDMGVFFDIWNALHNEALEFAVALKQVDKHEDLPQIIKLRIKLALAVSNPLQCGLRVYATNPHL